MIKSRPLLLLVSTLCLLLVGLAGVWISVLPRQLLSQAIARLEASHGLTLAAEKPRLSFNEGLKLEVEAVSLVSSEGTSLDLTAKAASLDLGWVALFGQLPAGAGAELQAPVITYEVNQAKRWSSGFAASIALRNGSLRLKDSSLKSAVSISDVNGSWTARETGEASLSLSMLQNGALAKLKVDVADIDRLLTDGSPVDVTWTTDAVLASLSGRAILAKGLQLDGQLTAEGGDANAFAKSLGVNIGMFDAGTPLRMQSGLSIVGLTAEMPQLSAMLGKTTIGGNLRVAAGVDQTKLSGNLTADKLRLLAAESPLLALWSDAPTMLVDLLALESDVLLQAQDLVLRGQSLGAAVLTLKGAGNTAIVGLESGNFAGGVLSGTLALDRKASLLGMTVDVKAGAVEARAALAGLVGISWLAGPLDFVFKLSAHGNSEAALISTLSGTFSAESASANVVGRDLTAAMSNSSGPWAWAEDESTNGLKMAVEGTVAEGIVTLAKSSVRAAQLNLSPKGEIDLLRQHLMLDVTPAKKSGAEELLLQGPWVKPAVMQGKLPDLRPGKDTGKPAKAEAPPAN